MNKLLLGIASCNFLLLNFSANAAQLNMNAAGSGLNYTLSGDTTYTGARSNNVAGAGVYFNTVNTTANLDLDGFVMTAADSRFGIYSNGAGAVLNISNGDIIATGNKDAETGWVSGYGLYTAGADAKINITNAGTVDVSDNGLYGINANSGSEINIEAQTVTVTGNKHSAGTSGAGIFVTGAGSKVAVENAKTVEISDNFIGVSATTGTTLVLDGDGSAGSSIVFKDNAGAGLTSAGTASVTISDFERIEASGNGGIGMSLVSGFSIENVSEIDVSNNGGNGLVLAGTGSITTAAGSTLKINTNGNDTGASSGFVTSVTDLVLDDVSEFNSNGNGLHGLSITGGKITVNMMDDAELNFNANAVNSAAGAGTSVGSGIRIAAAGAELEINGGDNAVLNANGNLNTAETGGTGILAYIGTINLNDMHAVNMNGNFTGAVVSASGSLNLGGDGTATSKVTINDNLGAGVSVGGAVTITDFNAVEITGNGGAGFSGSGANVSLSNIDTLTVSDNGGVGFSLTGAGAALSDIGSIIVSNNGGAGFAMTGAGSVLSNVDSITAINNGGTGINFGANLTVTTPTTGMTLIASGNTGTNADGIVFAGNKTFDLVNELQASNNTRYGISITGGTTSLTMNDVGLAITGNGNHGISVANNAVLEIKNLESSSFSGNGGAGLNAAALAKVIIEGNGVGTDLIALGNNGAGISILGADSSISGVERIIASGNGGIGFSMAGVGSELVGITEINSSGNKGTGISLGDGLTVTSGTGGISLIANGNGVENGVIVNTGANGITFTGTHVFDNVQELQADGNGGQGVHIARDTTVSMDLQGKDFSVSGNGNSGLQYYNSTGSLELKNVNNLSFDNNGMSGLYTSGGYIAILGENVGTKISASGNGTNGIYLNGTGVLKNVTEIEANNNGNIGFLVNAGVLWDGIAGQDLKFNAHNNGGVGLSMVAVLDNIIEFNATGNVGTGISLGNGADITTKGDVNASGNQGIGIRLATGSILNITGDAGMTKNLVAVDNNGGSVNAGFDVHGGKLNIDKMNIFFADEGYGILNWYSSITDITDSNFDIRNTSYGVLSSSSNAVVNISSASAQNTIYGKDNTCVLCTQEGGNLNVTNMNMLFENNDTAIKADFGGGNLTINGDGGNIAIFLNNTDYAVQMQYDDRRPNTTGSIHIEGMQMFVADSAFAGITTNANSALITDPTHNVLTVKDSTIVMATDHNLLEFIDGTGTVNFEDVSISGGSKVLEATGAGVGALNALRSQLTGQITTENTAKMTVNLEDTIWTAKKSSSMTELNLANTTLDLRGTQTERNTLTLQDYSATNGAIFMNTFIDSSGTNTDKIVLTAGGSTSGDTVLYISDIGFNGTHNLHNGIKIIDALNGTTSATDFTLFGGTLDRTAYEYELVRGDLDGLDPNSFFLRAIRASNGANMAVNMPALHLSIVQTGLNELRKRMGDLRDGDWQRDNGLWVRGYAKQLTINDTVETHMPLFGLEAGLDKQFYIDSQIVYVGAMVGYIQGNNIKTYQTNGHLGRSETRSPSFGVYGTWFGSEGWFVDAAARYFMAEMDVTSYTALGGTIEYRPDRDFMAASIEGGYTYLKPIDEISKIVLEPKIEVQYAYARPDDFKTNQTYRVYYGKTQSFVTKAALMLGYNRELEGDTILKPFAEISLAQEWGGRTRLKFGGESFKSDLSGPTLGLAVGLNAKLNSYSDFYSEITYEHGTVVKAVGANIGIRVNW